MAVKVQFDFAVASSNYTRISSIVNNFVYLLIMFDNKWNVRITGRDIPLIRIRNAPLIRLLSFITPKTIIRISYSCIPYICVGYPTVLGGICFHQLRPTWFRNCKFTNFRRCCHYQNLTWGIDTKPKSRLAIKEQIKNAETSFLYHFC